MFKHLNIGKVWHLKLCVQLCKLKKKNIHFKYPITIYFIHLYPTYFNKPFRNRISRCFSRNDTVVRITNTRTADHRNGSRMTIVSSLLRVCIVCFFERIVYSIRENSLRSLKLYRWFFISGDLESGAEKSVVNIAAKY